MQSNGTSIGRAAVLLLGLLGGSPFAARGEEAALGRLDRCKILHVYVPGTKLLQAQRRLWTRKAPEVLHAANRRNLARRVGWHTPVDIASVSAKPDPPLKRHCFAGIDAVGRQWFLERNGRKGMSARWVENGALREKRFALGTYAKLFGGMCPPVANWLGHGLLSSGRGEVWLTTLDRLWCYRKGQWSSVALPVPPKDQDPFGFFDPGDKSNDGYHHDQLFRDGPVIWLVRSANSNVRKDGSFLLLCTPHGATVVRRTRKRYICGIVRHDGTIHVLTGRLIYKDSGHNEIRPAGLFRVVHTRRGPQPKAAVLRRIAELDSDRYRVREQASAFLRALPVSQVPLLREALSRSRSPEQRTRLKAALTAIGSEFRVEEGGKLGGYGAARLVWISRGGRQYLQPWKDNAPQPLLLASDGGKKLHTIPLPGADAKFDLETDDGEIYLHTPQRLYRLDPDAGTARPILDFGGFAGTGVRLVAVRDGTLCFQRTVRVDWDELDMPFWVDPAKPAESRPLGGRVIATGVANVSSGSEHYRVAPGSGGRLWFLKYSAQRLPRNPKTSPSPQHHISTELWQGVDGKVRRKAGPCATSYNPSVWPLNGDAAIVVAMSGNDGISGHLFFDRGKTHPHERMKGLIEQHADRLLALMPDGAMYLAGPYHERAWLIRVKDGLCMAESFYERHRDGAGEVQACGIFRKGNWHRYVPHGLGPWHKGKPFFDRPVGVDCASGRMLAYSNDCKELRWIPVASDAKGEELVLARPVSFAWRWFNRTNLPRLAGTWILTPSAADRWIQAHRARKPAAEKAGLLDFEIEYESEELPAFRSWRGNEWRQHDASFYGGSVWEDAIGGIWHLRVREAAVRLPNGARQTFPLDALNPRCARLAVESPDAVWITTSQSLWRLVLRRDTLSRPQKWTVDRRFSHQHHGFGVAGPWICGDHFYYVSGGKLHHARLSELLGKRED